MIIHGIDLDLNVRDPELRTQFDKLDAGSTRDLFLVTVNSAAESKSFTIDVPSTVNCNWEVLEKYFKMRILQIDHELEIKSLMYKHK